MIHSTVIAKTNVIHMNLFIYFLVSLCYFMWAYEPFSQNTSSLPLPQLTIRKIEIFVHRPIELNRKSDEKKKHKRHSKIYKRPPCAANKLVERKAWIQDKKQWKHKEKKNSTMNCVRVSMNEHVCVFCFICYWGL